MGSGYQFVAADVFELVLGGPGGLSTVEWPCQAKSTGSCSWWVEAKGGVPGGFIV